MNLPKPVLSEWRAALSCMLWHTYCMASVVAVAGNREAWISCDELEGVEPICRFAAFSNDARVLSYQCLTVQFGLAVVGNQTGWPP